MAPYCNKPELVDYLNFSQPQDPIRAVACPFAADAGAGMGLTVFSLLFFGGIGLGLTIRTQHPAPIVVAGILSAGAIAFSIPGQGASILALVIFIVIGLLGLAMYRNAKQGL